MVQIRNGSDWAQREMVGTKTRKELVGDRMDKAWVCEEMLQGGGSLSKNFQDHPH